MVKLLPVKISMPQCEMQMMPILLTSYYGMTSLEQNPFYGFYKCVLEF